jgi:hypothetical protein
VPPGGAVLGLDGRHAVLDRRVVKDRHEAGGELGAHHFAGRVRQAELADAAAHVVARDAHDGHADDAVAVAAVPVFDRGCVAGRARDALGLHQRCCGRAPGPRTWPAAF